jgi:tetratricopeptide (TPR) repeat protein
MALDHLLNRMAESPLIEIDAAGWQINPQLRQFLLQSELPQLSEIHRWLVAYHQAQFSRSLEPLADLGEMLYHALQIQDEAAVDWCLAQIAQQQEQFRHRDMVPLLHGIVQTEAIPSAQRLRARSRLGQSYLALHEWQAAVDVLEEAQRQREAQTDQTDVSTQATDWLQLATAYWNLDRNFDAYNASLRALKLRQTVFAEDDSAIAEVLILQASILAERGQTTDAIQLSNQALQILEKQADTHPIPLIQAKMTTAQICCESETMHIAIRQATEALTRAESRFGASHYWSILCRGLLADLYRLQGQHKSKTALELYQQAAQQAQLTLGCDHPQTLALLQAQIRLLRKSGELDSAEELVQQVQTFVQVGELIAAPDVARYLNNVGYQLYQKGQYGKAEPLFVEALAMFKQLLGETHPDVAASLNNLAALYYSQGRYAEAEPLYVEALAMRKQLLGETHPDVATSLNDLANLYKSQGRSAEAEPLFVQAFQMYCQTLGETHPHTKIASGNLQRFVQQVIENGQESILSDDPLIQQIVQEIKNS